MKTTINKMEKEDLVNALDSLDEEDRDQILTMAQKLDLELKARRRCKVMFGRWSALELLAKLGIFMNKEAVKQED